MLIGNLNGFREFYHDPNVGGQFALAATSMVGFVLLCGNHGWCSMG